MKSASSVAKQTFDQVIAEYRARKKNPSDYENNPIPIEPIPNKPLHQLEEGELRRGIKGCRNCGGIGFVRFSKVEITDERFGKLYDCPECVPFKAEIRRREQAAKMTRRTAPYSLLRGVLLEHEFSNFDQDATKPTEGNWDNPYDVVRRWALKVIGRGDSFPWVYVYGDVGNGKTHLLAAAANGLTRARVPLIFATMPDTLAMITDTSLEMRENVVRHLQTVPALILDDFGTEKATDFRVDTTFRILNWRYTERLPTLFSSNIPPAYLPETRISSRILDKAVCVVAFNQARNYRERSPEDRKAGRGK